MEKEKKLKAKEELVRTLEENEDFKRRQLEKNMMEREQDKIFMENYSKILDKQEKDREDYFKKCTDKQQGNTDRMANTVIKDQEINLKEEENKIKKYQAEKNQR